MIEDFNLDYKNFFKEPDSLKRWKALIKIYNKDYGSFRVLFLVEVMAFLDKWEEPSVEDLNKILSHVMDGGRVGIRIGRVTDLFMPVWPLEVAKYDIMQLKIYSQNFKPKDYFFTYIKIFSTALVQTWWAFETLMNDFASIILEQRKKSLSNVEKLFLQDKNAILNKKGEIEERLTFQPLDARIQFIFKLLTGNSIDRQSQNWQNIMNLKNARDSYVHRIGKEEKRKSSFLDKKVILSGFKSVQEIISQVFANTPEFSERFIYKFLSFWSCKNERPFMWDGKSGKSFYLGLTEMNPDAIIKLYAPMESSFEQMDDFDEKNITSAFTATAKSRRA